MEQIASLRTDAWISAPWSVFLQTAADPAYEKAKGYYHQGHMRLEMLPVGHAHSRDDGTIALVVNLYCITQAIALEILPNCSYRKPGIRECQPDISCYFGDRAGLIPPGTSVVDLNRYPPPDL
ncbi:MAG: Uma2 family endonuclease, partial [Leptolyngbya sp. SIO4C5]|nr:Uma2 family endonuclease [Leptolyngbya sp. SIO4C5]